MKRFVVLCSLAAPASAQVTNCQLYPNAVSCQTAPQSRLDWSLAQPRVDSEAEAANSIAAQRHADLAAAARAKAVGKLVADGRCDDARKLALRGGDFALAQQVAEACK